MLLCNLIIDYDEIFHLLRDLTEVTLGEDVDEAEYEKFKAKIMGLIDDNQNGKLEAKELVSFLKNCACILIY